MKPRTPFLERIIALHHMTLEMAEQPTEAAILKLAVEQATRHLDIDRFAVFLIDDDPQYMRGTWGTAPSGGISDESDFRAGIAGHTMVNRTLQRRDLVAVEEPAAPEPDLLNKADRALYQAKAAGRNCLRVFSG